MDRLLPRAATEEVRWCVRDFRVVVVNGPRQSGKTTLLKSFQHGSDGSYRSLDDEEELEFALADPITYAGLGTPPRIIDEVQRAGDPLVLAIKRQVDTDNSRGQFLLSGSSHFLTVPTLSESLAGRAVFIDLWPLSMNELTGSDFDFATTLFDTPDALIGETSEWTRDDYLDGIATGGFPEVLLASSSRTRRQWFASYVRTVVNRDIQDFAEIEKADQLPRLLSLIAARSGTPYVPGDIAKALGVAHETARRYTSYLEMVFAVRRVPAWSTNVTGRITKTPKMFITDSGLATHLSGTTLAGLRGTNSPALGGLVETFVLTELLKHQNTTDQRFDVYHYRARDGREVDFICEGPDGRICAIEVKATATPKSDHAVHLRWLRDKLGDRFVAGLVLHLGTRSVSYGDRIYAAPVSTLWGNARTPGDPAAVDEGAP